jgi:ADP-heptose:LPS heptosyltransferase
MPEGSPSVLIIRLDGIGDALALTPLLAEFHRRAIPVDVVLQPHNAGVFSAAAARSEIVASFELRSNAPRNVRAIELFGNELRARNYSHVLVATEDPGGYRLAAAIAAPVRIGFSDPRGKPLKALWTRRLLTSTIYRSAGLDRRAPHECAVLFTLGASLLGGSSQPTHDDSVLRPLVLDAEPPADLRVAVQITDKYERAKIPLESVVELIRRLEATAPLLLIASRSERAYAQRVAAAIGASVTIFDELAPWKAALGAAAAIVTPDSGASHLAGMIGTPVVTIFPPQRHFALQVARWKPWAAPHRIVCAGADWPAKAAEALAELLSTYRQSPRR